LILIGHVQLSVEDPYASDTAPRPTAGGRPLSCYATMSVGPFSDKKQARKGQSRDQGLLNARYSVLNIIQMPSWKPRPDRGGPLGGAGRFWQA
jgi:hypothetical protein